MGYPVRHYRLHPYFPACFYCGRYPSYPGVLAFIDCFFGVLGVIPLWIALEIINKPEESDYLWHHSKPAKVKSPC